MSASIEGELSLVVLEQHARWPACASQYQTALPNSLVEAQSDDELPYEFAERVGRRIASIASKGGRLRAAIIAANGRLDPVTLKARYRLATSAIQAMGLSGELVLTAAPQLVTPMDERIRHEIFALAGALCDELAGTEIGVSVRFPEATDQSGLRPSVHRAPSEVACDTASSEIESMASG